MRRLGSASFLVSRVVVMQPVGVDTYARFFFRPAGRIGRQEFALGIALILVVDIVVLMPLVGRGQTEPGLLLLLALLSIPIIVAQLVLVAKRCHDIGRPGSYLLILFVPVLGLAWLVALLLIPGKPEPNAYGPAPRFDAPGGE